MSQSLHCTHQRPWTITPHLHVMVSSLHVSTHRLHVKISSLHVSTHRLHVKISSLHVSTHRLHVKISSFHSHKRDGNHNTPFTCLGLFLSLAYKRPQTITNLFLSRSLHCTCIKETTDHNKPFPVSVSSLHLHKRDHGP